MSRGGYLICSLTWKYKTDNCLIFIIAVKIKHNYNTPKGGYNHVIILCLLPHVVYKSSVKLITMTGNVGSKKCLLSEETHSSKSAAPKCSDCKLHNLLFPDLKALNALKVSHYRLHPGSRYQGLFSLIRSSRIAVFKKKAPWEED